MKTGQPTELNANVGVEAEEEGEDPSGEAGESERAEEEVEKYPEASTDEDCEPKRTAPDPGMPTQAEVEEHNVDHLPYRSWCECCVRGKATGEPHKRVQVESTVPIISFDYMSVLRAKWQ